MDHQPFQTGVWALPPTDCHRAHQLAHCHDERHLPGLAIFSICIFLGENLVNEGESSGRTSVPLNQFHPGYCVNSRKEIQRTPSHQLVQGHFQLWKKPRGKSLTILCTCQRIQQDSDTEWKFGLAKLIRNMHRTNASPSPINLSFLKTSGGTKLQNIGRRFKYMQQ